jgi:hypothetical protein
MSTIKNIADLTRLRLNANSQDAPVDMDERAIIAMAEKAMCGLLPKYIAAYGTDVMGVMCVRKYFDVTYDDKADLKYVDTEGIINTVGGNLGLISVSMTQDDDTAFAMQTPAQQSIYSNLEAGQIQKPICWWEGGRIYFKKLPSSIKKVVVRGIPNFLSLDIDATIPMPADLQDVVIETIVQRIMTNKAEDKPNDGNDNKQTVAA